MWQQIISLESEIETLLDLHQERGGIAICGITWHEYALVRPYISLVTGTIGYPANKK